MAKAGFWLRGATGSLAGSVVSKSPQGTVIREKVTPTNPKTTAQVDQRAKLKLISQLGAAMGTVIAIPRENGLTGRNLFTQQNLVNVYAQDGAAYIDLNKVQITKSRFGVPEIKITRGLGEDYMTMELNEAAPASMSRVIYNVFEKINNSELLLRQSVIGSKNSLLTFPVSTPAVAGDIVVYAYGMSDLGAKASAKYEDYKVRNGADIASLIYERKLSTTEYQVSKTVAAQLAAGETEYSPADAGYIKVRTTTQGNGSTQGSGQYLIGAPVSLSALPSAGYIFKYWLDLNDPLAEPIATSAFTFVAQEDKSYLAVFEPITEQVIVRARTTAGLPLNDVAVVGGGSYPANTTAIVSAPATYISDDVVPVTFAFQGWSQSETGTDYLDTHTQHNVPIGALVTPTTYTIWAVYAASQAAGGNGGNGGNGNPDEEGNG